MRLPDAALGSVVGLATVGLSVFGAMLLLGALMEASEDLSEAARASASSAASDLTPAAQLRSLTGERDAWGEGLGRLHVVVAAAPGGELPLHALTVHVATRGGSATFPYAGASAFRWEALLDNAPPLDAAEPVAFGGDLVQLTLDTAAAGLDLPPRAQVAVTLQVGDARPERVPFTVPATLQTRSLFELPAHAVAGVV